MICKPSYELALVIDFKMRVLKHTIIIKKN